MRDPRTTPDPDQVVSEEPAQIGSPLVDLLRGPDGPRDRQLLFGDHIYILNRMENHALIRAGKDGYCGYVPLSAISPRTTATHKVTARASHAYAAPDFKSSDQAGLSFGASCTALSETPTFIETTLGFVPRQHVRTVDTIATDPAAIASLFLGAPYLWGGNSHLGIDCSGLVQAACLACGLTCPADSDEQAEGLGAPLPDDTVLQRNDLIFWEGHVAIVTDETTIIHANVGHMAVAYENTSEAIARIETQGDGTPTHFKRLPPTG